ncbi:bromodomain-containing protein 4-like isoform X12 [Eriocheir sinensis]|uniref:bromodomain-containing protein 4-like isoform X12 n=1 Tax=Eriocheir sinensis TaxID=95602 RepID=UPI0021C57B4F|nr:bromodomain-containing protein 4-like isoform X12 [Eriocheir sinensis]
MMPANVRPGGSAASQKPPHAVPTRAMSLDSLHEKKSTVNLDQKIQEYLPTRVSRAVPKINHAAMQFVKVNTGPAGLYKSAAEQLKKAEEVKELRKTMVNEETEWQEQPSSSSSKGALDEGSDWQSNLDKWKSSRRKRLQTTVDSIIQIKKNEEEEELSRMRKKSKTFSQIQEDKTKRGRKYNLTVHNDDDNDLSSLGLSPSKSNGSIADTQEDQDAKDLDQDNKDAKSDAGFCTGSDTGSDGVFAEDNISDTSSALGDKKEAHDSLLDTGGSKDEEPHLNGHSSSLISESFTSTTTTISSSHTAEYTYDKAIAGYKQYAENSAKKRTSSITSLNSNASQKEEDKKEKLRVNGRSPSPSKGSKLEEKVSFFSKEMEKENRVSPEPKVVLREKSPKVNISQRRSMFENVDLSTVQTDRQQKQMNRRSLDIKSKVASFENLESEPPARVRSTTPSRETNLRSKVSSFENLTVETNKVRGITPPRDANFHVKLATFTSPDSDSVAIKKRTPERDANFHKKLASFTAFETEETSREQKIVPQRDPSLKKKIASYEQLEQAAEPRSLNSREESMKSKDRSVSLENLDEPPVNVKMRPARSMMNITRRTPSTPYMEVELESSRSEKECVVEAQPVVSCKQDSTNVQGPTKRTTVYEIFEKCQVSRDVESAPLYSIFQYLSPEVNAQVFEIASKLEETPLLGSPINKAPSSTLDPPTALEEDSLELAKEYSDADINEVINDYEQVGEMLEDSSDHPENIYENITDEPTYENIYEKVDDGNLESHEPVEEHQYQTLEEVRKEVVPPPPPPARIPPPKPMEPPEVLDVTWTDGPSQAAPPSEPPPPPPPDDDSDSDASEQPQSLPAQEEDGFKRENSTRRLKKELWRRRSDFLGTSSQYIEEQAVKPPPDLSDLLRQEREAERSLIGSKVVKTTTQETLSELEIARREREIIENLERSEQMRQQQELEQQQSWGSQREEVGAGETDDHLQYQEKLAELEEEMMRHDKDMLRRAGHLPDTPPSSASSQLADPYENQIGSIIPPPVDSYKVQRRQPPSHLPLQEFYTAPTYESTPPLEEDLAPSMEDKGVGLPAGSPSQYTTLASPHPFSRSSSHSSIETNKHVPLQAARSTPLASPRESIPEPLPRKNKVVTPPVPSKTQRMLPDLNTAERLEAMRVSRMTSSESLMSSGDPMEPQGGSSALSGQQMSKQTLLALSAIPKPRLTDNESWIKKKEGQKRDYSKHWLHQEAEQRRLEQQDRISRPKQTPPLPQRRSPQSASPQFPPHQHPSSHTASYQPTQNTSPMFSPQSPNPTYSSYPQALRNPSPSRNASSIANNINNNTSNNTSSNNSSSAPISPLTTSTSTTTNNNSNSWRNQATTYQPHVPAPAPAANGDKALPESIINNLTQRINNKNTKTTYNSSSGRAGSNFTNSNYRDENYHDYMNADALSSPSGPSPLFQAGQPSPPSTQQAETNTQQDQRLLSVSGKKKCSHCSEELGRGAAMIIESLRLFYHIPCFKCCVCGIQLGNGSAGADVRVRNHKLHCHNCYSNDEGMKFSKV